MSERGALARSLRDQASVCRALGSPLYAALLDRAADDTARGGPCWTLLEPETRSPLGPGKALALRLMAAVHRLVLRGDAPELAAHFPSAGGVFGDQEAAWGALVRVLERQADDLAPLVARRCQTNEVGRSAALVGGFLEVARATALPLRILELGASAGLNLRWDRYRYEAASAAWGDPGSAVRFEDVFEGDVPFDVAAEVVERRGCDLSPVDPATADGRLTLRAHVWADQLERLRMLDAAIEIARTTPAQVDRAAAAEWLEARLGEPTGGVTTVVFHSIVMDQVDEAERRRILGLMERAGEEATREAPLAWLRMEHDYSFATFRLMHPTVWLRVWPGGSDRRLARVGAHGRPVRWAPQEATA